MKKGRLISLALCICMVMSLFTGFAVSASADDVITHTVVNGDYLFKVCKSYGLDYYQCKQAIMALNGFTSDQQLNHISVGQQIKLPASNAVAATVKATTTTTTTVTTATTVSGVTTTTSSTSTVVGAPSLAGYDVAFYLVPYTVQNGDNLNGICNALGSNYPTYGSMILAMNGIASENKVWAGKSIYIPTNNASAAGAFAVVKHKVSRGETMTSICNNYGVNYVSNSTLVKGLNNTVDLNNIKVDQIVYVPLKNATALPSSPSVVAPTPAVVNTGYNITFNSPENGAPYAAIDNVRITKADAWKEVYIIPNANSNYSVKSMAVTRLDTNANVIITDNHFVMPQSDVKVSVTYSEGKKLTKSFDSAKGSVSIQMNGENITSALYGNTVTVITSPKAGYAVSSVEFQKASDSSIKGTAKKVADGVYSFTMPNYNTKVVVTFTEAKLFTLKSVYTGNGTGNLIYTLNDIVITQASRDNTVVVYINPDTGCGLAKDGLTVKTDTVDPVKVTKIDDSHYSFTMPTTDAKCKGIQATAKFEKTTLQPIFASNVEGGSVYFTDTEGNAISSAIVGSKVYIVPVAENSKYVKSTAKYAHGDVNVAVNSGSGTDNDYFIMPDSSILVTPEFSGGVATYHITKNAPINGHGNYVVMVAEPGSSVYNDVDKAQKSSKVKLIPKPDAGYVLAEVEIFNAEKTFYKALSDLTDNHDGTYSFDMPDKDISVWVRYERSTAYKKWSYTPNYSTGGTVNAVIDGAQVYGGEEVRVGATIELNIAPAEGYEIEKVTATLASGVKDVEAKGTGYYPYLLPEESDVKFDIYFKPVAYEIQYSYPAAGDYEIYIDGTKYSATTAAYAGQTITIKTPAISGYEVATAAVDEISILTYLESDGEYTFTMPARNVKTQVTYKAP